jgi:UDP-N-acetyl-2-amino-2-deoxyglucuronate dehydrogenase
MIEPFRVVVCGTGNAGMEHLRSFADLPDVQITAIVDHDTDRGRAVAVDLLLACPALPTLAEALRTAPCDAVVVATPNDLHASMTVEAARAGKHILLEKPAAITNADLQWMNDEVAAAGVHCQVNMILRWHPMIQAIVSARDTGRLGEIFCVEADFIYGELEGPEPDWARTVAQGGSLHLYAGCHAYDQLEWIAGSRVQQISAVSTRRSSRWEFDVSASAVTRFANGAIGRATVTLEAAAPYKFGIRVLGTKATIVDNTIYAPQNREGQFTELSGQRVDVTYLPFDRVASDFVANARSGTVSHSSLARTVDLFQLALDADTSARENRVIERPAAPG